MGKAPAFQFYANDFMDATRFTEANAVGLYVSSAIFIAVFMRWQGKFSLVKSCLTGLIVSVVLFAMFEIWFNVPLLKGPLEAAFGY